MIFILIASALAQQHHGLRLVDDAGTPFACATLETIHHIRYQTDDDGWVAIHEPGLEGETVWFEPSGPGVVPPLDWIGLVGFSADMDPGGTTTIELGRDDASPPCGRGDVEQRLYAHGVPTAAEHHELQVLDAATGRPVPAIRLLIDGRQHWTDNGGRAAFFDLDDMSTSRPIEVFSHGYRHTPGYVDVIPVPGGSSIIEVERVNVAERLVRLTGGGTWRDSVILGHSVPAAEPLLDGEVIGMDTARVTEWRGGLFWIWGDTNRPSYPLGLFNAAGATSILDPTPEDGIDLDYFEGSDGFVHGVAPAFPEGPVWLGGLISLSDTELWAHFINVTSDFSILNSGMVRWNDSASQFDAPFLWEPHHVAVPWGPAVHTDMGSAPYVFYRSMHRVPADPAAMGDPDNYQAWTPLRPDGLGGYDVDLDSDGVALWEWRADAPMVDYHGVDDGTLPEPYSPWHQAMEPDTGETPVLHQGGLSWNPVRGRWIHVYTESFGVSSLIGEIWYAEGDTPVGPWTWTRQIMSHDSYSFYNPIWHPWFASDGGERVLFEGTYTGWLGTEDRTPRHDYNQFLYALELDDPALALPAGFYEGPDGPALARELTSDAARIFAAYDREVADTQPITWSAPACDPDRRLEVSGLGEVAFWAHDAGTSDPSRADLVEWTWPNGDVSWSIEDQSAAGATAGTAVASVWEPRWTPVVPLSQYDMPEAARAGADRCGLSAPVTLDGSASSLADGITTWTWSWDGGSATGESPTVSLPPGQHVVTLTVESPHARATDTVFLEVLTADTGMADTGATHTGGDTAADTGLMADTADSADAPYALDSATVGMPDTDTAVPDDEDAEDDDTGDKEDSGCGCSATPTGNALPWVMLLALHGRRRR